MSVYRNSTSGSTSTNTRLVLFTSAGNVAVTAGSNVVTGSSTAFLNNIKIGDRITINSESRVVTAVTSDTVLLVDQAFVNAASGQTMTYYPRESTSAGAGVFFIRSSTNNTGVITYGQSMNAAKDGTDITTTSRSSGIAPGETTPPLSYADLRDWFVQSTVASQVYSVIIN